MSQAHSGDPAPGRFAYEGLDRVLHEKARLGLLVSLTTRPEGLLFAELNASAGLSARQRAIRDAWRR